MIRSFVFAAALLLLASCDLFSKKKREPSGIALDKLNMMEADRAFSRMSEEKGMKTAFMEYIDSNGVLLRANHLPIEGADAIDYLLQQNDTGYTLKWEPRNGTVAQSGDLGYTYGIYALQPKSKDTIIYGTYVSIWKKQKNGQWKYVLDTGNEGIGEEEQ
jgi:ketosteroid isomerase-like protein